MKGKLVYMLKKWWLTLVVFTLVIPLVSCSKKKKEVLTANYGFTQCDGDNAQTSVGQFDVYLVRSKVQSGYYDIVIQVVEPTNDVVSIWMANSSLGNELLKSQVVIQQQYQEIVIPNIPQSYIDQYPILAITGVDGSNTNLALSNSTKANFCEIPLPGDGASAGDQYYQPY